MGILLPSLATTYQVLPLPGRFFFAPIIPLVRHPDLIVIKFLHKNLEALLIERGFLHKHPERCLL